MSNPADLEGSPNRSKIDRLLPIAAVGLYQTGACTSGAFTALGLRGILTPELTTGILRDLAPLFLCVGVLGDIAVALPVAVLLLRKLKIV